MSTEPTGLKEVKRESRIKRLAQQFTQFIIVVLIAAAVVAALMGEFVDAGAIIAIVLLNGLIGFLQEEKAERVMEALKRLTAPGAKVIRDGKAKSIEAAELVPGDIVLLESGDHVPADCRLIESTTLRINEAALTGESLPIDKTTDPLGAGPVPDRAATTPDTHENIQRSAGVIAEQTNMAFLGTNVVYGRGTGVVTATGMGTETGRIAHLLQQVKSEPTPLQQRLSEFARKLVYAAFGICALVFVLGIITRKRLYGDAANSSKPCRCRYSRRPSGGSYHCTCARSAAHGQAQRLNQKTTLLSRPSGPLTVIASDKQARLTQNQMTVRRLFYQTVQKYL